MKRPKSDIPQNVIEQLIREYRQDGSGIFYRLTACLVKGQVVGQRAYTQDEQLVIETPLKNGEKHGREYTWDEDGSLSLIEPYLNGKIHGTAKQYGRKGQVIGTYSLRHGTGFDIWRDESEDGTISISEIHSLRQGLPHGYEWWLGIKPHTVWHERYWEQGQYHGIERLWNADDKLSRGYPKYWIRDQRVTKRQYLRAAQDDPTLPPFRLKENSPRRRFPPAIDRLLLS
ncbi:MAG: hypothetical protein AABN33_14820 [Acidobacteriota bacterium]